MMKIKSLIVVMTMTMQMYGMFGGLSFRFLGQSLLYPQKLYNAVIQWWGLAPKAVMACSSTRRQPSVRLGAGKGSKENDAVKKFLNTICALTLIEATTPLENISNCIICLLPQATITTCNKTITFSLSNNPSHVIKIKYPTLISRGYRWLSSFVSSKKNLMQQQTQNQSALVDLLSLIQEISFHKEVNKEMLSIASIQALLTDLKLDYTYNQKNNEIILNNDTHAIKVNFKEPKKKKNEVLFL